MHNSEALCIIKLAVLKLFSSKAKTRDVVNYISYDIAIWEYIERTAFYLRWCCKRGNVS